MKKIVLFFLILITYSCGTSKKSIATETKKEIITKQEPQYSINKTVPYKETVIMVGHANREGFKNPAFSSWFDRNLTNYKPDITTVNNLKPLLKGVTVKTFMGTWCGDSKRETPRFYNIMDAAEFDYTNMTMITVTRQKNTPEKFEEGLNITNVPTFIFYKDGKEINRIVEYPIETLEKDIYTILSGAPYKHAYMD